MASTRSARGRLLRSWRQVSNAVSGQEVSTVISVDVFDTLLLRTSEPLGQLARRTSRRLVDEFDYPEIGLTEDSIIAGRLLCHSLTYWTHRHHRTGLVEPTLTSLWQAVAAYLDPWRGSVFEFLAERGPVIEFEIDCTTLRPNTSLLGNLAEVKKHGAHLMVMSDMYWESTLVKRALKLHAGAVSFDVVMTSATLGLSKRDGSYFDALLQWVHPSRVIHVGDDLQAEIKPALERGIDCLLIPPPLTQSERRQSEMRTRSVVQSMGSRA